MAERLVARREIIRVRTIFAGTADEYEAILPDEVDLAITNNEVAVHIAEKERLRSQEPPPNIAAYREQLPHLKDSDFDLAREAILDYERTQASLWDQRCMMLAQARARQARQLTLLDDPMHGIPEGIAASIKERVFLVRPFTYGERLEVEEETSELDPRSRQRRIRVGQRNIALLERCLIGEVHRTADGKDVTEDINHAGGDHERFSQVLIDRQWSRVQMSEEVQSYFRGRSA